MRSRIELERDLFLNLLNLGHIRDPTEALGAAVTLAAETLKAERAYLEVYPRNEDADPIVIHTGMEDENLETARRSVSHGIIADAIAVGRITHTPSALLDTRYAELESVQRQRIEGVVCAPIGTAPVLGVLYLAGSPTGGPFAEEDLELLTLVVHHIAPVVRRLFEGATDQTDHTQRWRKELNADGLIGKSQATAQVLQKVALVAPLNVVVLLTGASGTGKSLLARLIHDNSDRRGGPFVHLNCANFADALLESELFGAVRGAHSTATSDRKGKVAAAAGGTLFLDEIAELSSTAQAKLLLLLQSGRFYPVGSTKETQANVRVITATNADLAARIEEKSFREDLFYRINVFPIRVPSLAERPSDIPLLAQHFASSFNRAQGLPELEIAPTAAFFLETQEWSGNVRELQNAVQRACIRARGDGASLIDSAHFGEDDRVVQDEQLSYREATRQFQRRFLEQALVESNWNVSATAALLKIARSHLYDLINAFGLTREKTGVD